jgi:hypothetical protein
MTEAYEELVKALEEHLQLAASNKTRTVRDKTSGSPSHSIADAIERLIEEKLAVKRG